MIALSRPTVLCVRPRLDPRTPPFIFGLMNEWLEALALHCAVSVVEEDFDFLRLCDQVRPDFVLFEDLTPYRPVPLRIANGRAHPRLPRVAIAWGDPHDIDRSLLWRVFDEYGVEALFGYGHGHAQHMPELAPHVYSTNLFVDAAVFRDYGLPKIIPISAFGRLQRPGFYAWRNQTVLELQQHIPTFVYSHPGYGSEPSHAFSAVGEHYARLLNQSHFSLADTTRLHWVVRKHLEIPAAGSVLVSPDTPPVGDYGFVDMENCILGSGEALRAKIDAVSRDPSRYEQIRAAGHALVHARFTREAWRTIPDWFECRRACPPGNIVQQVGQFGPFRLAPEGSPRLVGRAIPDNEITSILRAARDAILGDAPLEAAEAGLRQAIGWIGHLMEPWLLLGVVALLRGAPDQALHCLARPAAIQEGRHRSCGLPAEQLVTYDPVELAWMMIAARLSGDEHLLAAIRTASGQTRHVALRRAAWLMNALDGDTAPPPLSLQHRLPTDRLSVHWLGQEEFPTWLALIRRALIANGRADAMPRRLRDAALGIAA